jgi:hypothetical protein
VLHSEILPQHGCDGELIELPEDEPIYVYFAQSFPILDDQWETFVVGIKGKLGTATRRSGTTA